MNEVLSIYCYPKYETTKSVLFCMLKCQYKNRCQPFIRHYLAQQAPIDEYVKEYQQEKNREKRDQLMEAVVPQAPVLPSPPKAAKKKAKPRRALAPAAKSAKSAKPSRRQAVNARKPALPQATLPVAPRPLKPAQAPKPIPIEPVKAKPTKPQGAPVKRKPSPPEERLVKPARESTNGAFYLLIEERGNRAMIFPDESALVRYLAGNRVRARYFKAQEVQPTLRLIEKN